MNPTKQAKIFDKHAKLYEKRRNKITIDTKLRKKLLANASGNILEVSAGTGTNFPLYRNVTSLTAVDFSPEMVRYAKGAAQEVSYDCTVIQEDVEELMFQENQFDTIVSTLSMCSYPNPDFVLGQMSRWCKPGGQILLFEHGISSNKVAARLQEKLDPLLSERIGCHLDRDIIKLVNNKLKVTKVESHLMGTFHLIWATPYK
ncbi:class I SAM-dependent methyltransferase [Pseudalkalibacillus hwajinpoensis]|uniref:Class I SAM-dependent methyltransferase n=1 Tax=Guptibacillus hwajinpoensis TaxID=208199 RepID=A0A4U1MMU7_9BACL|nr:class I SAM-dependent methyltransferase [Pseudalkalibacillus hwajinpoensis]TKD72104.1 class I SAM-dependent methyltransferase [Pseudalkalibacillus hwajinpoensis]